MRQLGNDPLAVEEQSVTDGIAVQKAHAKYGAPPLPRCIWGIIFRQDSETGNETDISPAKARTLVRMMRIQRSILLLHAARRCRRGLHTIGDNDTQCRECRNASRRKSA